MSTGHSIETVLAKNCDCLRRLFFFSNSTRKHEAGIRRTQLEKTNYIQIQENNYDVKCKEQLRC